MKYLRHYLEQPTSTLFTDMGAFFAFTNATLHERSVKGIEYCSLGNGIICPTANAQALLDGLAAITKVAIAQDLSENGRSTVIYRELVNHECFYDGDISRCCEALESYGISRDEIIAIYNRFSKTEYAH